MLVNKETVLVNAVIVLAFALVILLPVRIAWAQSSITFQAKDNFAIPALNGNINFDLNGTYSAASLENTTWIFTNLQNNDSLSPLELRVSVQDCNVTIASCRTYNATVPITSLRYIVEGQGIQSFKLAPIQRGGEWSVIFNRTFVGEDEGWTLSSDGVLTVTRAPSGCNITLTYFFFPDSLGGNGNNPNLPFYEKHSAIISTGVVVAAALSAAALVTVVSKRNKQNRLARKGSR